MADDELSQYEQSQGSTSMATAGVDELSRYEQGLNAPPQKGFISNLGDRAKAFAANIPVGLAEVPEELTNLGQYAFRHGPDLLQPFLMPTPGSADPTEQINAMNRVAGAPPQPYLDITGQLRQNPAIAAASAGHPIASQLGQIAGGLPLAAVGGEAAGLSKLPALGRVAAAALGGGAYGAGYGALGEAGQEIKENDELNPQQIGKAAAQNFGLGAALGGGIRGLGEVWGALTKKPPALKQIEYARRQAEPRKLTYTGGVSQDWGGPAKGYEPPGPKLIEDRRIIPETAAQREARLHTEAALTGQHGTRQAPPLVEPPGPKLIERGPLIPPGPAERARMQSETYVPPFRLIAQVEQSIVNEVEKIVESIKEPPPKARSAAKAKPPKGQEAPTASLADDSWREHRTTYSEVATPEERELLLSLAKAKIQMDAAAAKLEGALNQLDPNLQTRVTGKYITPELDLQRQEFVRQHGMMAQKNVTAVEATMAQGHQFKAGHVFAEADRVKETAGLMKKYKAAEAKYKAAKKAVKGKLPPNKLIQVAVRDTDGNVFHVNIKERIQPNKLTSPIQEINKQYKELKLRLQAQSGSYTKPFGETLDRVMKNALENKNELAQQLERLGAFKGSTKAKLVLAISLTAAAYLSSDKKAEAAPPAGLVGRVLKSLEKVSWDEAQGFRPVSRITLTQVTTDILRQYSPGFSRLRDGYMEKMTRLLVAAEQQGAVGQRAQATIEQLDKNYRKALIKEIARVEAGGGKGNRYWKALQFDLHDLGGNGATFDHGGWINKLTGGIYKSIFLGNYRAASMHMGEALVAYVGKHPIAATKAFHELVTNPVYREYAALNAPKGMFQQFLEKGDQFQFQKKFDKLVNEPIDNAIKHVIGQNGYDVLSAQLPERAKLGLGAVITAEHNAANYPGGPQQFMQDWMQSARTATNVPTARQAQFAKVSVKNFIDENKAIMRLPDAKIQERTFYQRHGDLIQIAYPALRAINQQTRFFASLADDAIAAVRARDRDKLAQSVGAIILGHFIVAGVAGAHVIPGYIWSVMESVDKPDTNKLKEAINDAQHMIAGGYQVQDFGIKYFPYMRIPNAMATSVYERALRGIASPKDKQQIARSVIDGLAGVIVSRIGPQGSMNLDYLWERLQMGMKGTEDYKRYNEYPLMDIAMGRPYTRKTAHGKVDYGVGEGLLHWLFKIENPQEQKIVKKGETKSDIYLKKDIKKIEHKWQHAMSK